MASRREHPNQVATLNNQHVRVSEKLKGRRFISHPPPPPHPHGLRVASTKELLSFAGTFSDLLWGGQA